MRIKTLTAGISIVLLSLTATAGCGSPADPQPSATVSAVTTSTTTGTHAGIVLHPMVPSPWPDLPVYRHPNVIEPVSPGDEFCIGLDINSRLGMKLQMNMEGHGLTLEESETVYADPQNPGLGTCWYRFKVTGTGNAFVTLEMVGVGEVVVVKLLFIFYSS